MEIFTLVLGAYATNTYIIIDNSEAVVIDPAERAEFIIDFISQKNATVKHILITHAHFDHIGGAAELKNLTSSKLYISKTDYDLIDKSDPNSVFYCSSDMFNPDIWLNDGGEYNLIGHSFTICTTPGHTPGSVCFVVDDNIIFSGDTLFCFGVGRTDFPYGDKSILLRSLKKLFLLPHDYRILPGHGELTTLDFERKNNPYA